MIGTSSTALMAVSASTTEQWLVVVSGLSFFGLLGVAFFFAAIQPSGSYPSPFGDHVQIERFFSGEPPAGSSARGGPGARGSLVPRLRRLEHRRAPGGRRRGCFVFLGSSRRRRGRGRLHPARSHPGLGSLATGDRRLAAARTRAARSGLPCGGPAHVLAVAVFLGASSLAVFTTDVLSEWVAWLGLGGAAVSAATVLAMVWYPAAWILPITRMRSQPGF